MGAVGAAAHAPKAVLLAEPPTDPTTHGNCHQSISNHINWHQPYGSSPWQIGSGWINECTRLPGTPEAPASHPTRGAT